MMRITKPEPGDYPAYYKPYVDAVPEEEVMTYFVRSQSEVPEFLRHIPADKLGYAYAPDKWTIAEVIQHVMDAERVFAYRGLCIARGEQQPLPSFDQDLYVRNAETSHRSLASLVDEWSGIRHATISLFAHLPEDCLDYLGFAAGYPIRLRSLPWIIAWPEYHHWQVLQERYL